MSVFTDINILNRLLFLIIKIWKGLSNVPICRHKSYGVIDYGFVFDWLNLTWADHHCVLDAQVIWFILVCEHVCKADRDITFDPHNQEWDTWPPNYTPHILHMVMQISGILLLSGPVSGSDWTSGQWQKLLAQRSLGRDEAPARTGGSTECG